MKVGIVIPFYKNYDTIEDLFRSIDDQDYKDIDVSVVIDGEDFEADSKILDVLSKNSFGYQPKIKTLKTNRGASVARNTGAKEVEGDILFFVDADCKLYPGMITECEKQLKKNPDVDFIYGNYRFEERAEYHANPFDPYLLETMNYICTMSPMRRKAFDAVGGFKKGQKYFQDWSLFYRMVKNGSKGKYINENIFSTKFPDENGISGTQGLTLDEKAKAFRKEHGIKEKSLVVTSFGAPSQAIERAKMLGADYIGPIPGSKKMVVPANYKFKNWKATLMVGCYNAQKEQLQNHLYACHGRPIIQFIGTDIWQLMHYHSFKDLQAIREAFDRCNAKLFANSPRLVQELKALGFDSDLLFSPIYEMERFFTKTCPPSRFTVGVYYSNSPNLNALNGNNGQSNVPYMRDIALSMPDIEFKFFGDMPPAMKDKKGKLTHKVKNIEYVGKIPVDGMNDFINSCSMLIRSTVHDGFPHLPIQFLLSGRPALVSCPDKELKYVDRISVERPKNYGAYKDELVSKIYEIKDRNMSLEDCEALSKKAQKYYGELMSVEKFREAIDAVVKDS